MSWLLDAISQKISKAVKNGANNFDARNNAQVYLARNLSRAYAEYFALESFK